ncbi:MAG: hypothetical protein LBD58_00565 [Treponema sp.]|jgi:hypothetical protein|nr:hypothetical protein [Treponema sp.]
MEIKVEIGGRKRKELAAAVGETTGAKPVYKGAPSYAYAVGDVLVTRDGSLVFEDGTPSGDIVRVLSGLSERGFHADTADAYGSAKAEAAPDGIVIQMPLGDFTETGLDNLRKLVAAKARLIKKSLGAVGLPIEKDGDKLCFPWLGAEAAPEEIAACTRFIAALCAMAKKQKRVLTADKPVENEKYAFRCFLLRIGFIGEEYAEARRILLRNMIGNGSMKSGEPKRAAGRGGASGGADTRENAETTEEPVRQKSRFSLKNMFFGFIAPR